MTKKYYILKRLILTAIILNNFSCRILKKDKFYNHFSIISIIKSNDSIIQDVFGEDVVDFYLNDRFLIVKKEMIYIEDGKKVNNAYEYYLSNRYSLNTKVIKLSNLNKEYYLMPNNTIDSIFSNNELHEKITKEDYKNLENKKDKKISTITYFNIKNKTSNNFQIDSIVFSYLNNKSDSIFPLWKIENYYPIINLEVYSRFSNSSMNSLSNKIIIKPVTKDKILDSILMKYKNLLD